MHFQILYKELEVAQWLVRFLLSAEEPVSVLNTMQHLTISYNSVFGNPVHKKIIMKTYEKILILFMNVQVFF